MKKNIIILFISMASVLFAGGQTATVTLGDHFATPGQVTVPMTYTNFTDIGAITLFIEYDATVATFVTINEVDISGVVYYDQANGNIHTLGISWTDVNGLTSTGGTLLEIVFNYTGGTTSLHFGQGCELGNIGGSVVPAIYTDGSIAPDPSAVPITIISQLNLTPPFSYVDVPVEADFSGVGNGGVGSFNFEIEYDPSILTFDQLTSEFEPGFIVNTLTSPARVSIVWTTTSSTNGTNINGALFNIRFTYSGGNSDLTFLTSACEVADFNANVLSAVYTDGMVTQDPATMTNIIIGSTSSLAGTSVDLPVTVTNFNNVGAFDYVINFDDQVLQFNGLSSINPSLSSGLLYNSVGNQIFISWSAVTSGLTLSDNDLLFNLQFYYLGTTTDVTFDLASCSMADYDTNPINANYVNGQITEIPGGNVSVCLDTIVTTQLTYVLMPVEVTGFINVGAITLELNYDENQLNFVDIESLHSELSHGSYLSNAANGTFTFSWTVDLSYGQGIDIPNNDKLFYIKFWYISGPAPVTFNLQNSEIADWDAVPYSVSYCNGLIKSGVVLDIKAFLEGLYNPVTHEMNKTKDWDGSQFVDKFPGTVADVITVELHDAADYSNVVLTVPDVELNQDGTASLEISELYTGTYWVTIKNRNHLETVSKNSISFASGNISYDFTTNATQAYGDNQTELETGVFGIYAGDVTQDGLININDGGVINISILTNQIGYLATDIDGNGIININDAGIVNINVLNSVVKHTP